MEIGLVQVFIIKWENCEIDNFCGEINDLYCGFYKFLARFEYFSGQIHNFYS